MPSSFSSKSTADRPGGAGRGDPGRAPHRPGRLDDREGNELLRPDRRGRRGLALDRAPRARCRPGGGDALRSTARDVGLDRLRRPHRLRHPEHPGRDRRAGAAARPAGAERRHRRDRRRPALRERPRRRSRRSRSARPRSARTWTRTRIPATSTASSSRPARRSTATVEAPTNLGVILWSSAARTVFATGTQRREVELAGSNRQAAEPGGRRVVRYRESAGREGLRARDYLDI